MTYTAITENVLLLILLSNSYAYKCIHFKYIVQLYIKSGQVGVEPRWVEFLIQDAIFLLELEKFQLQNIHDIFWYFYYDPITNNHG